MKKPAQSGLFRSIQQRTPISFWVEVPASVDVGPEWRQVHREAFAHRLVASDGPSGLCPYGLPIELVSLALPPS